MDESDDTMSSKDLRCSISPAPVKVKPKKRSLVERELETNLTEKITTPIANSARYGRKRYIKNDSESNSASPSMISVKIEKTPVKVQSPIYRMHASNSPVRGSPKLCTSPKLEELLSPKIENQIENIYKENQSLSRFSTEIKIKEERQKQSTKVYIRQDLIQSREKEKDEPILLIKNLFSPMETYKSAKDHLEDISSRPKSLSSPFNVHKDNSSVVKTLDFDDNKNTKIKIERDSSLSKSDISNIEANCEYKVGDLAWARVGTYPFWPCIVTRDPSNGIFVRKKLYGRIERDVIHVTFFGDNGRRSWIVDNMLRKYKGKSEFEATRQSFTAQVKKRDPRLYAAFFVSEKKQALWNISVEEAETMLKEPRRLRIDLLNAMLENYREAKVSTKREKSAKINRTNSDVSLSESLYDTLFSETDEDADKSKVKKTRNPSLDVSEVVTACLDDMAAKTGISSIKRQSHMDRWLQKAKSNTPEKLPRSQVGKSGGSSKTRQVSIRGSSRFRSRESQRLLKNENRNSEYQSSLILVDSDTNSDSIDDNVIAKRLVSVLDIDNNKTVIHNYCKSPTKSDFKENSVKDKNSQIKRRNQCDRRTRSNKNDESNYNKEIIITNDEPHKVVVPENDTKNNSIAQISPNGSEGADDIDKCNISKCQDVRSDKLALDFQDNNSYKDESIQSSNIIDNKVNINENEIVIDSADLNEKRDKTKRDEKCVISEDILTEDTDKSCNSTSEKNAEELSIDERFLINNVDENSMTYTQVEEDEILNTLNNPDKQNLSESVVNDDKIMNSDILMNSDEENSRTFSKNQEDKISASSSSTNKQFFFKSINNDDENNVSYSRDTNIENLDTSNCHNKEIISKSCHNDQDKSFLINNDDVNSTTSSPNHDIGISDSSNCLNEQNLSKSGHNDRKMSIDEIYLMNNTDENSMTFTQVEDVEDLDSSQRFKDNQNVSQNFKSLLNTEGDVQIISTDATKEIDLTKNISEPCLKEQSKLNESSTKFPESEDVINTDNCIRIKENGGQSNIMETDKITGHENGPSNNIKKAKSKFVNTKSVTVNNCLINTWLKPNANKDLFIKLTKVDFVTTNHKNSADFSPINNKNLVTTDIEPVINFDDFKITNKNNTETKSTDKTSNGLFENHIKLWNKSIKSDKSSPERVLNPEKAALKSSELSTQPRRGLKAKSRTSVRDKQFKATQEPEFISYLESKQDKILEENPQLTQEDVTKYLYSAWLYKEDKNSDFKTADDNKNFNLVKGLDEHFVLPIERNKRTATLEIMPAKKKRIAKDKLQPSFNGSIKKYFRSTNCVSKHLKTTETLEIEVKRKIDNKNENKDISTKTKLSNSCAEKGIELNGYTESMDGRLEENAIQECGPRSNSISCEIGVSSINNYILESHQDDPEFIKYLELKQDALIEENPELSHDDVVKYLYKTWLYNKSIKTELQENNTDKINVILNPNTVSSTSTNCEADKLNSDKKIRADYFEYTCSSNKDVTAETLSCEKDKSSNINGSNKDVTAESLSCEKDKSSNINDSNKDVTAETLSCEKDKSSNINDSNKDVTAETLSCEKDKSSSINDSNKDVTAETLSCEKDKSSNINDSNKDVTAETLSCEKDKSSNINDSNKDVTAETLSCEKDKSSNINDSNKDVTAETLSCEIDKSSNINGSNKDVTAETLSCEKDKSLNINCSNKDVTAETLSCEKDESSNINLNNEIEKNKLNCEDNLVNAVNAERVVAKVNGHVGSKESTPETVPTQELDSEAVSSSSEVSVTPTTKRRIRVKNDKSINHNKKTDEDELGVLTDPEFVKYMELKQDALLEENSELTREEIIKYLYKTWLYGTSNKSELKRNEEFEQLTLVKGLNQDAVLPAKKYKKRPKVEKTEATKTVEAEIVHGKDATVENCNEKPKRRVAKACYNEDFYDFDAEFKVFDIFKTNKNKVNNTEETKIEEIVDEIDETADDCDYGDEEVYFEELTTPKPNLFKGLIREKVCEICESTSELVKCKGCHCFFHVSCVKKELESVDTPGPSKGRKKKKKGRGRRPKDGQSIDSECNSDDKSQDVSVSDELNVSFDEMDLESHLVADADIFEAHLSAKMKELLDNSDSINYGFSMRKGQLNWKNSVAGKCEIVDVQVNLKIPFADSENSDFKCNNCQKYDVPVCFVCRSNLSPKTGTEFRQRCQVTHCHRYYHLECLDYWPQTQFSSGGPSKNSKKLKEHFEAITCPRHVCHTCVCDDPRGCKTRFSGDKLARCVRCPATYHSFTKCLPAGSQILTGSNIICPRHTENRPGKVPCHVNTGWCYICTLGGTLMCCEYCPMACHAECLNIKPPDGVYMCEDCETGRLPLYGEMVWAKLGHYRWWPGIILHPSQIPANVMAVKHSQGEFVVRFFGQYDHYWVNRGRVFPYQEDDSLKVPSQKSKINADFTKAIEHAKRACEILKNAEANAEEQMEITSSLMPPHYVKLKVNKPVGGVTVKRDEEGESLTQCDCDPNQEDPCGPLSQCLNRMLLTECGPTCRAGDRCSNRAFEKRQYPRLEPYRTPLGRGWGLRTLDFIPQGQFVIEYVGELIDEEEFQRRMRRKHDQRDENYYFLTLDKERMIDAGPKGNLARFMNHCCEPNCETQKWTVLGDIRVGLFAIGDIPENSEVTFNYNLESAGIEKKRCLCGAKRCSGYIGAKPKQDVVRKKTKFVPKKTYHKKKVIDISPTTSKRKPKIKPNKVKPKELTEIEKDLLIIKNATNGLSSDNEGFDGNETKDRKAQKRKRVSFSTEEKRDEPSSKKTKIDV